MNHQIQKQILDVTLHVPESEAFGWQHRLSEWANGPLATALARALDACAPAEEHWQIEELTIELNAVNLDNFEDEILHKIAQALEQAIKEKLHHAQQTPTQAVGLKNIHQNTAEAFVYFLQTGLLPWAYRLPTDQTWEQAILQTFYQEPVSIKTALFSLLKNAQVRERLIAQFSQSFLEEIVATFGSQSKTQLKLFFDIWLEPHDPSTASAVEGSAKEIWNDIWNYIAVQDKIVLDKIIQQYYQKQGDSKRQRIEKVIAQLAQREKGNWTTLLTELQTVNPKSETLDAPALAQQTIPSTQPNNIALHDIKEIYVQCAGLVLLHPFLPRFFEGILCTSDDELVWHEKAALSLHFLATGQSEAAEYELTTAKILCGIPIHQTLPKAVTWQPQDTEEAEALLAAVIKYWPVLKDSSIDLLRAEFLQRAGKLSRRADGWLLQVEKRDFDFYLLTELPWSFSTIKLPWMKEFLWVEWV